ncbi:MAG: hypothetical protein EXS05_11960 [Planctomycetaceae bacterium]|nr:hypothetical protein [Planctomycetaceae bacterium]
MADSAHVTSIEAIAAFTSALRNFEDEASRALLHVDQQAQGALQWLEHDAPFYWKGQIRTCYDEVARTRTALETCKMRTVAGNRPACLEEQQAFRAAQRRLRQAEEMIEVVRRRAQKVLREYDEYRGRVMNFRLCLERGVPRTLALLDRTVASLDTYVDLPPSESSLEVNLAPTHPAPLPKAEAP